MPPVGFEPTIWAGERPQTYALDRAVTWNDIKCDIVVKNVLVSFFYSFTFSIHKPKLG